MRARGLLSAIGAVALGVALAAPAAAKTDIAAGSIRGPGLEGKLVIETPDTYGLWESGIDVAGGLDDTRADSIAGLGLGPDDLGPRYRAVYKFVGLARAASIRQDVYPYAEGGPVTYTPPGQQLTGATQIVAGWYRGSSQFFDYLVERGFPQRNPVTEPSRSQSVSATEPLQSSRSWAGMTLVLSGVIVLGASAVIFRRRRSH